MKNYYYNFNLIVALFRKEFLYVKRYKFNTIFGIVFMGIMFILISKSLKQTNDAFFFYAYVTWLLMVTNYSSIMNNLTNELSLGTLEQLFLSSRNFIATLLFRSIIIFFFSFFQIIFLTILIKLIDGTYDFSMVNRFLKLLPQILLGMMSIWGISFIVSAFMLKYRNVNSLYNAVSTVLFAGISYMVNKIYFLKYILPFGYTSFLIQKNEVYFIDNIFIIINSMFYLIVGILIFNFYLKRSKHYGSLAKHS